MGRLIDFAEQNGLITARSFEASSAIGAQVRQLQDLSQDEVEAIVNKMDALYGSTEHPVVFEMVTLGLNEAIRAVQAVKAESKQSFGGLLAQAQQLDINQVRPGDFARVGGATSPADWLLDHSSTGGADWIGTSANEESMSENEAMVFFGVIDPVEVPKISAFEAHRFTVPLGPTQGLTLRHQRRQFGSNSLPAQRFSNPLLFLTEDQFHIRLNVEETGRDRLEPIGVQIARRGDVTAL